MGRKVLILAALSSLIIYVNAVSVPMEEFVNNFQYECYSRADESAKPLPLFLTKWNNDRSNRRTGYDETYKDGPISMSVESLIALIEKIESLRPKIDAKELALILLRKYRTDDLEFTNMGVFQVRNEIKYQNQIENAVLGIDESSIDISKLDRILDMEENCTLHFLLSHNVDLVAKRGDKTSSSFRQSSPQNQPPKPANGRQEYRPRYSVASLPQNTQITKKPREYGVGTFRQDQEQAINLNKLLLGVIAGLSDNRRITVADLYSNIRSNQPFNTNDIKLNIQSDMDPLMAVTLAAVLSYGAVTNEQVYQNLFGATGKWNSTLCPVEFDIDVLKEIDDVRDIPGIAATMAEIRGAIDAYSIGKALRQMRESNGNSKSKGELKLSQILRMYYSPLGFQPSTTEFGYCQRQQFRVDQNEITRDTHSFKRLFILLHSGPVKVEDTIATGPVDKVKQEFFKEMDIARRIPDNDRDWCENGQERVADKMDKAICETRSDVFVLIDHTQDGDKMEKQFELIDKLAQNLDLRRFGSSLSILALAENSSQPRSLRRFAWEDTNKGCATCKLAFADLSDLPTTFDTQDLPTYINGTLANFELERQYEPTVPSRTFIIMNFGSLEAGRMNVGRFNQAKGLLNTYHRNTKILVVSDKNNYDYLIENKDRDFFYLRENDDISELSKKLLTRICETPALFQHPECHLKPSQNAQYTGYLTPGHVQHWAMYPQFFYKSFNIEFIFKADKGKLRVCHAKSERPGFENQNGICYENRDNEEIRFNRDNPCHKFTRESCAPFYFTIYGTDESGANPLCKEEQCANMKQIQFTFTHTGISCNKAFGVTFSPILVIATILAVFAFHTNRNQLF